MKDTSTSSDTTREILPVELLVAQTNITQPQSTIPNTTPSQHAATGVVPQKQ